MKILHSFILVGITAVSILLVSGCPTSLSETDDDNETNSEEGEYEIGDTGPAGGIIFYVDENDVYNWSYLEAAPKDTEWQVEWADPSGYSVGVEAQDTSIGAGASNTVAIIEAHDDIVELSEGYAAKKCDTLTVNNNSESFEDWFLPSKDELNQMYVNLQDLDGSIGNFETWQYWSSTESDAYNASYQSFGDGDQGGGGKQNEYYVRAARSF